MLCYENVRKNPAKDVLQDGPLNPPSRMSYWLGYLCWLNFKVPTAFAQSLTFYYFLSNI
jgi:hypothetical protein